MQQELIKSAKKFKNKTIPETKKDYKVPKGAYTQI